METIRFIHAADLHLGSPFKGITGVPLERLEEIRGSTYAAFRKMIGYACDTEPDFVLIAGDVYDGEDRSLKAQQVFREGMVKLQERGIPVFVCHGNHDHLAGKWTRFQLPSNVYVFGPEVEAAEVNIRGQRVVIHGFSYPERHVRTKMIGRYPAARDEAVHIGMLHGSVAGDETHAVYAPFTKGELLSKGYEYWALGHIHLRHLLSEEPPVVYSGNLQGRHRNEPGPKGVYEVELSKEGASLTFVPQSVLEFKEVNVACKGIMHADEWVSRCIEAIDREELTGSAIIQLTCTEIDEKAAGLLESAEPHEWLELIREALGEEEPFIWVDRLKFVRQHLSEERAGSLLVEMIADQLESWDEEGWKTVLRDVYGHSRAAKYVDPLQGDDYDEIRRAADEMLRGGLSEMR